MGVWLEDWMGRCMAKKLDGCMDGCTNVWLEDWMGRCMVKRLDGCMVRRLDG